MIRLFNRLDGAVSHHRRAREYYVDEIDEALYHARDKILADYASGEG